MREIQTQTASNYNPN